jgi:hypothetical protein
MTAANAERRWFRVSFRRLAIWLVLTTAFLWLTGFGWSRQGMRIFLWIGVVGVSRLAVGVRGAVLLSGLIGVCCWIFTYLLDLGVTSIPDIDTYAQTATYGCLNGLIVAAFVEIMFRLAGRVDHLMSWLDKKLRIDEFRTKHELASRRLVIGSLLIVALILGPPLLLGLFWNEIPVIGELKPDDLRAIKEVIETTPRVIDKRIVRICVIQPGKVEVWTGEVRGPLDGGVQSLIIQKVDGVWKCTDSGYVIFLTADVANTERQLRQAASRPSKLHSR